MPEDHRQQPDEDIPLIEWVIGVIGAALVVGALLFLLYRELTGDGTPPNLTVEIESVTPVEAGYRVQVIVRNRGQITAQAVMVEGELTRAGESVETSQASLDYVAAQSEASGGLFFTRNPEQFELQVRATGYQIP